MRRRIAVLAAVATFGAGVAAGCGGDDAASGTEAVSEQAQRADESLDRLDDSAERAEGAATLEDLAAARLVIARGCSARMEFDAGVRTTPFTDEEDEEFEAAVIETVRIAEANPALMVDVGGQELAMADYLRDTAKTVIQDGRCSTWADDELREAAERMAPAP